MRFFTAKGEKAAQIHRNLVSVYGGGCMSLKMVDRWRNSFANGRDNVHDNERFGRPTSATDDTSVIAIRQITDSNRRLTLEEIPPNFQISQTSL